MIRVALLLAAFVSATALSACGRAGSPERPDPPPGVTLAPIDPIEPRDGDAPDKKFVLDPILQ